MRKIAVILLIVFLASCKSDDQVSSNIEIKDKSELIIKIADMYFMEVYISRTKSEERDSVRSKMGDEFLTLHGMTVAELDEFLDGLKNDKKVFSEIMDSVSNLLNIKNIANKNKSIQK